MSDLSCPLTRMVPLSGDRPVLMSGDADAR